MNYPILVHTEGKFPEYTLWFQLTLEDSPDMAIELLSDVPMHSDPEKMTWVQYCLEEAGVESLFSLGYHSFDVDGLSFGHKWAKWGMRNGIAPYQPFTVRVSYDSWKSYEGEWDAANHYEVVGITPLDPLKAARRFQQWKDRFLLDVSETVAYHKRLRIAQEQDVMSMFLKYDYYWPGYYDDMTPPTGISISLYTSRSTPDAPVLSRRIFARQLLSARDDGGSHVTVKDKLFTLIREKMPHVNPESLTTQLHP